MALHDVAAEPVLRAQRQLEVHPRALGDAQPATSARSVSCITSAVNAPPAIAVAVRQTPLTATESPSPSSPASALVDADAHAVARRLDARHRAQVGDQPGEHVHHSRIRAEISTSSPIRSTSMRSARIASEIALRALALERVAGVRAADARPAR